MIFNENTIQLIATIAGFFTGSFIILCFLFARFYLNTNAKFRAMSHIIDSLGDEIKAHRKLAIKEHEGLKDEFGALRLKLAGVDIQTMNLKSNLMHMEERVSQKAPIKVAQVRKPRTKVTKKKKK